MFWKIAMLSLFFILTIGIGLYYRSASKSAGDFVLGGRNVGPWLSAFAYGTTYFSATIFIGYSGQFGWSYGVSAFWIGIGNALIGSLLAWVLLGRRTRIMTKALNTATMPDFFAKRYGSGAIKIAASIIIFIFLIPYTASVYKGLSGLFSACFGIDFIYCIVGMAVLTAIFVIAGGYMGTAVNNFIQGIIMLVGIVLMIIGVLNANGGFSSSMAMLSKFSSEAAPELNGAYTSMFGPDPLGLLSVVLLTSLGTWGLPQMVHKFYAIKNEQAIRTGTLISTIFALIIAGGSYFIGAFGRLFWTEETVVFDKIIPNMITSSLPDVMIGLILLVVLSASISSLASLVITSSSTFVSDFLKAIKPKAFGGKHELPIIRVMCAGFIIISVLIAIIPNSLITTLMSLSWGALSGAFLGPFIYGLFWKRTTKLSVWVSMISGVGIVMANYFIKFTTPTIAGSAAMIFSLIIVPLVSLITPKPNKTAVDKMFSCYDEKVVAPSIDVLEETK
ncbi:MAG: sodium:solute symporter [Eubacteriales bacterium]